ncbi:hypothetical protein BJD55_gp007 [Gordonia phage Yvonnetastic]|uniref:Uncharacterized protein n=1 Tax=Gordonia phage Yvonnetastic TaxID=1821566 RepID=A0A142K8X3_9CAUD|nr:hypothetical protein BJD55_gp007 [Gordonia phage Yvonnetastic]AMS02556.1 hypothetical protein SEA_YVONNETASTIC_7 [Gordonia phage Yvonnetastic]WKW85987.1 hypothetical protein SEA_JONJAMES_6 [Gordonia Phage JonJames]
MTDPLLPPGIRANLVNKMLEQQIEALGEVTYFTGFGDKEYWQGKADAYAHAAELIKDWSAYG